MRAQPSRRLPASDSVRVCVSDPIRVQMHKPVRDDVILTAVGVSHLCSTICTDNIRYGPLTPWKLPPTLGVKQWSYQSVRYFRKALEIGNDIPAIQLNERYPDTRS